MPAVRPQPRATSRGLQIWLIVAFGVAVVFASLFFINLADRSKIIEERDQAREDLRRLINRNEQNALARFYDPATPQRTMVGRMSDEIVALAKLATGASTPEETNATAARERVQTLLQAIQATEGLADPSAFEGANLHDAARTLHTLYVEALKTSAQLQEQNKRLTDEKTDLTKQLDEARRTFSAGSEEMAESLAQVESERDKFRAEKDAEIGGFQRQLAQVREEKDKSERRLNNRIIEFEQAVEARDKAIAVLQDKIDELVGPAVDPEALAAQTDGQIIQAVPSDPLVYINLGKKDHLPLGVTFAVFSPPIPGQPREKAKATIEVIGVHENTAECRIVHADPANPLLEGDLIANAIYDRHRPTRFVIAGQFDLDYDGQIDPDGYDRVGALIQQWGGQLADGLDERIDFIVIGTKPPVLKLTEDASPEQQERHKEQKGKEEKFLALKNEARALSIPMLTQAQFFRFIGRLQQQSGNGQPVPSQVSF